jgi:ribulose-phosphate 3-epimerase
MSDIAISILNCDFNNIKFELNRINDSNIKYVHIDIMDGYFVEKNTENLFDMKTICKYTNKKIDVHLMVKKPKIFITNFLKYNPDIISFHIESEENISENISLIKSHGIKCGIAINPETDIQTLNNYVENIDVILIMSVVPGKGGQKFISLTFKKIKLIKEKLLKINPKIKLEIDGGVNNLNSKSLNKSGADILVSGSYLINQKNIKKASISLLKV